jgi:hypothetical protein
VDVTSTIVERLVTEAGTSLSGPPSTKLAACRRDHHRIAPTLLSTWLREGRELRPGAIYEIALHQSRNAEYSAIRSELLAMAPRAYSIKGVEVEAAYPDGLVRETADIDIVTPALDELWAAVQMLVSSGWRAGGLSVLHCRGKLHVATALKRPSRDPYALNPDRIELATFPFWVDLQHGRTGEVDRDHWRTPDTLKNVLALLHERAEEQRGRPRLRARDLLDISLLLYSLDVAPGRLTSLLTECALWRPWREFAGPLARASMLPSAFVDLRPPAAARTRVRVGEIPRALRLFGHPDVAAAAWMQRRLMHEQPLGAARRLGTVLQNAGTTKRAFRLGLPLFGVRVDDEPSGRFRLESRGGGLRARTPVGSFALALLTPS